METKKRLFFKPSQLVLSIISVIFVVYLFFLFFSKERKNTQLQGSQLNTGGQVVSGKFDQKSFKTDAEWKKILTSDQYYILRQAGTEVPFTGALDHETRKGTYYSAGCDKPLFRSEQKYDSGTGWPSFWAPINIDAVVLRKESAGDDRTEVLDTCGNHLGHIFDDGPQPTGKRYCMNSIALKFVPDKTQ